MARPMKFLILPVITTSVFDLCGGFGRRIIQFYRSSIVSLYIQCRLAANGSIVSNFFFGLQFPSALLFCPWPQSSFSLWVRQHNTLQPSACWYRQSSCTLFQYYALGTPSSTCSNSQGWSRGTSTSSHATASSLPWFMPKTLNLQSFSLRFRLNWLQWKWYKVYQIIIS